MSRPRIWSLVRSLTHGHRRLAALLAVLACACLLGSSQAFALPAEGPGVGAKLAAPNATFTVNQLDSHDDGVCDADCTLVEAVNAANTAGGANTIVLPTNATFLLTQVHNTTPSLGANGLPVITSDLIINGNGAIIARDPNAPDFRFFQVGAGASLALNQVTLLNGRASVGGGLGRNGGCVLENNSEGVTLYQSSLEDCTATNAGSAVYTDTALTVDNSTLSLTGSSVSTVWVQAGTTLVRNSTISGNTGSAGLYVNGGTVGVTESTLAFNNTGLFINAGAVTVTESLLGANTVSQVSGSYSDGGGNYVGAAPQLSPLRYWGGPTKTHYPTPGSPARNISGGCAAATDQRGARRPGFGNAFCDAGAVESSDIAVTNTNASGAGSLRQAILDANSTIDLQVIYFSIGSPGVQTIQPTDANPLPDITDPVVIDGLTQGGAANSGTTSLNTDLRVEIDGSLLTTDVNGLKLTGNNNVIRGLVINHVYPASYQGNADGIEVASTGNRIEGNYIGTNPTGTVARPNSYAGVRVLAGNNIIGGRTPDAKNLLSGNLNHGVFVAGGANNVVQGNFIGPQPNGTTALYQGYGVSVVISASNTTIGGPLAGQRNIIAGHNFAGVFMSNNGGGTRVLGNYIGTTAAGSAALGNAYGIELNGSPNNTIGGSVGTTPGGACTGDCNLISGNTAEGIYVINLTTGLNIQGNFIGTNAAGTGTLPNTSHGIHISGIASGNNIGGTTPNTRNIIAGNAGNGVYLESGAASHTIRGNYIGILTNGATAGPNGQAGILLSGAYLGATIGGGTGTSPGGACTGACNLISGNTGAGIQAVNSSSLTIQGNFIGTDVTGTLDRGNGNQGIVLDSTASSTIGGTTANLRNLVSGNGAEGIHLRNSGATNNTVQGNFIGTDTSGTAGLGNTGYGVHFEGAPSNTLGGTTGTTPGGACTGACNLIARNSIGVYIEASGASGNTLRGNFIGTDVNGTAALNNTSEGVLINLAPNNAVGGTTPAARNVISGNGTYGIQIANGTATGNTVQGNFIGVDTTGAVALGNGNNGILVAGAGNTTVGGTTGTTPGGGCTGTCNLISGNNQNGVVLYGALTAGSTVQGNFIGVNASGTAAVANANAGVALTNSATGTTVGGTTASARNIIAGNGAIGVILLINAASNTVEGNFIGLGTDGTTAIANVVGVWVQGAPNNTVGGTTGTTPGGACTGACNVISGNGADGIVLDSGADGTLVQGNFIGTDVTGTLDRGNTNDGVLVSGASNTTIGNGTPAGRNIISGNTKNGIELYELGELAKADDSAKVAASGNVIQGNFIGTDTSGMSALGNSQNGILLDMGATNDTIGGTVGTTPGGACTGVCNLVAANVERGVYIRSGSHIVQGNFIGTNVAGALALGNGQQGVYIDGGSGTTVGSANPLGRNLISGNGHYGIDLFTVAGIIIQGNYIGVNTSNTAPLANTPGGIFVNTTTSSSIGGTLVAEGNVIRGNAGPGVALRGASTGISILSNVIRDNAELGIDLNNTGVGTGDGVTPNDPEDSDSGPNGLQNFPVLQQVTASDTSTFVLGTLSSTADASFRVEFFSNSVCDASGYGEGQTYLGYTNVTTDGGGNAQIAVTFPITVPAGSFITATATDSGNNTSEFSPCQPAIGVNTSWSQATRIPLSLVANPTRLEGQTSQFIVTPGGNAWFKFSIQPHAEVTVDLSNLPADYDLALYRDPNIEYDRLTQPITAVAVAARAAPEGFLPEGFLPEGFLPEGFLPEGFLPEGFLPEGFLPEGFLPEGFLRERFQPTDSPPSSVQPEPYALAELTSLLAVSANESTRSERILRNTYDSTGDWYIQVRAKPGASSLAAPFTLVVDVKGDFCGGLTPLTGADPVPPAGPPSYKTIVLTNLTRLPGSAPDKAALQTALTTFMARPEVAGVLVDLGATVGGNPVYPRVAAAYTEATDNPNCPLAKNVLAEEIKKVVDAYRQTHPLEYVVVIGADDVVPFFRGADRGGLADEDGYYPPVLENTHSQSSLRLSQTLGQDEYGSSITAVRNGFSIPLPDLAVGRLVETAGEAAGMINTYLDHNGVLVPTTGLVTGYDFVADVASAVKDELNAGLATTVDSLIQPEGEPPTGPNAWTASQLRTAFLGSRHDMTFFAGHFSAVGTEAADYRTRLSSAEVAESSLNLANAFAYSVGCHSGYNIPDSAGVPDVTQEPDWAQAFARKGVTSVMGTGYQYGDTEFIEYSERLYYLFTRQLRSGSGPRPVGKALVQAKNDYLAAIPQMRGLHEKALRVATLYGLPMYSINMPGARLSPAAPPSLVTALTPVTTGPGAPLLLSTADITVTTNVVSQTKTLVNTSSNTSVTTTYFEGRDGVVVNPLEPILPLQIENVTYPDPGSPKRTLRGVGWRGGAYTDWPGLTPLTGAPTTELSTPHPAFASTGFFPSLLWSVNYFDAFNGGKTLLDLFPAQFKSDSLAVTTGTFRTYGPMKFRLFYNEQTSGAGLAPPPTVTSVQATLDSNTVHFTVLVDGQASAGIQQVWILYTASSGPWYGEWRVLDLSPSVTAKTAGPPRRSKTADTQAFTGSLPLPSDQSAQNVFFLVQAANGVGGVTLDTNGGQQYGVQSGDPPPPPTLETTLTLGLPATGAYRDERTFTATLTHDGGPLANQTVQFSLGGMLREAQTNANGVASFPITINQLPNIYEVAVEFKGAGDYLPSLATGEYTVEKQGTSITLSSTASLPVTRQYSDPTSFTAVLDDDASRPIAAKTVFFVITGANGQDAVHDITTNEGRATMQSPVLPSGTYSITAYFAGALPAVTGQDPIQDARYTPSASSVATSAFIITPETANVSYTGQTNIVVGQTLQLTATVGQENDGFPGDLRLAQVKFIVKDNQNTAVATRIVNADLNGLVTDTVLSLAIGSYTIETQVQGGYFASDLVTTPLVVQSSVTSTPTATPTGTATATRTVTQTPTATATPTRTATQTPTATATPTRTATQTPTATATATATATPTATATSTSTSTTTATRTPTATATLTPLVTVTSTPTRTPIIPSKPAVFRNGSWFLRNSLTDGPADLAFTYGLGSDVPIMCDWDGNGSKTPGVFRNGTWYLKNSNAGGNSDLALTYGMTGDTPICGDWDGNGTETVGIVRGGVWYLRNSNTTGASDLAFNYGLVSDRPVAGDWNGDQVDTPGIFRSGVWYLRNSNTTGPSDLAFNYGTPPGDTPLVGDWNGDGVDTPGVTRGNLWLLRNSNSTGAADIIFTYGAPGDRMLIWR